MKRLSIITLIFIGLGYAGEKGLQLWMQKQRVFIFKGVIGPLETTVVPSVPPTQWTHYHQGSKSRLSVFTHPYPIQLARSRPRA